MHFYAHSEGFYPCEVNMAEEVENVEQNVPEGESAPESATNTAAEDKQQTGEVNESASETEGDGGSEGEQPQRTPWYQKRIDELTRARREAERRAEALEAMMSGNTSDEEDEPYQTQFQGNPQHLIEQRANELARQQALNEASNRTYSQGKAVHDDFDAAVQGMGQLGEVAVQPAFLEAVTSLPNGHEVYYHLGKNLDEAAHVLSLPPVQMALELAKVSAKVGRPKKVSDAPPPASESVTGSAKPSADLSDDLPIEEWMKRRDAQIKR